MIYIYIILCTYVYTSASILMYRTKTVIFFYNVRLNSMHDYEINGCGVAHGGGLVELRPTRMSSGRGRSGEKRTEAIIERNHWQPGKAVVANSKRVSNIVLNYGLHHAALYITYYTCIIRVYI